MKQVLVLIVSILCTICARAEQGFGTCTISGTRDYVEGTATLSAVESQISGTLVLTNQSAIPLQTASIKVTAQVYYQKDTPGVRYGAARNTVVLYDKRWTGKISAYDNLEIPISLVIPGASNIKIESVSVSVSNAQCE